MVAYKVAILPSALDRLARVPRPDQKRLQAKIDQLSDDPRPAGAKRLHGKRELLRLRSGHYRVIYTVEDNRRAILIIRIGHRREVYRHS